MTKISNSTDELIQHFLLAENFPEFSKILKGVLPAHVKLIWGQKVIYKQFFESWQAAGFTILPNHYYSPIPDISSFRNLDLSKPLSLPALDFKDDDYLHTLTKLSKFKNEYADFANRNEPRTDGLWFSGGPFGRPDTDAAYSLVRSLKPSRIVEIGSGHSTLVLAEACQRNINDGSNVEFISIDPYPSDVIGLSPKGLSRHIKEPVENLPMSFFEELNANDVLFIDSSHVYRRGGDVEYEFFDIIPRLKPGVWIHVHDIFLPNHYPVDWVINEHIFWNEQYLLAAFLSFNSEFEMTLPLAYLSAKYPDFVMNIFPGMESKPYGGSFWFRRVS
jgi:hypothetical protein